VLVSISFGGVFNTVLLETRQRAREMAVLKAIGMAPRQVVALVVASVVPIGIVAGLLGVPIGLAFQRGVLSYMGETFANTNIPEPGRTRDRGGGRLAARAARCTSDDRAGPAG
jgi:putative ABC transport system permease protein